MATTSEPREGRRVVFHWLRLGAVTAVLSLAGVAGFAGLHALGSAVAPGASQLPAARDDAATTAACSRLMPILPRVFQDRALVSMSTTRVGYGGRGAVTVVCGVPPPSALSPTSELFEVRGDIGGAVAWVVSSDRRIFTAVDRQVFIAVGVPSGEAADLATLSEAISTAFPQVCTSFEAQVSGSRLPLCAHRTD